MQASWVDERLLDQLTRNLKIIVDCSENKATFVRMGVTHLMSTHDQTPSNDYPIESFVSHENYRAKTKENDIAVVKLIRDVSFKNPKQIRPACLWQEEEIGQQQTIATGFGSSAYGRVPLGVLMKVRLDLVDMAKCLKTFEDDEFVIDDRQICAGNLTGGSDTCQGGNLMMKTFNHFC